MCEDGCVSADRTTGSYRAELYVDMRNVEREFSSASLCKDFGVSVLKSKENDRTYLG